jgi:hypothetical protein
MSVIRKVLNNIDRLTQPEKHAASAEAMVFAYYHNEDEVAEAIIKRYLVESGRTYDLGRGYKVAYHRQHVPKTQDHLHFSLKGRDLYSINRDGTAHDSSHGKKMHNQVVDGMKTLFPDFIIPPYNIIESFVVDSKEYLVESSVLLNTGKPLVPPDIIGATLNGFANW